ncbi:MAG: hypothetical protein ACLTG0_17520 [Oscillibacter sp.]
MTIKGFAYDEKKTAGERLVLACSELPNAEEKVIGSYRGFELSLRFDTYRSEYQALLKGQRKYTVPLGTDPLGNIIRSGQLPEQLPGAHHRRRKRTGHPASAAGGSANRGGKALPAGGRTGRKIRTPCGTECSVGCR